MTLVLPGSVQLRCGHRRAGLMAIRVWGILLALAVLLGLTFLIETGSAMAIVTFKPLAIIAALVLGACGVGWALLMLDAWRLSSPPELARRHRLGFAIGSMGLSLALAGAMIASASVVTTQSDFMGSVFAGGGEKETKDGRYNVLLMGGDAGADRTGLRPDSMTVASIDANTGQTVLMSLPRNLEDVEFPADSPMKKLYPEKFSCPGHECLLNAVYTKAAEHPELYPGVADPGAQATKEAIEWVTGLDINYYAMADLNGFQALVDSVGGVTVDINKPIPVGGGSSQVGRYLQPGKGVHLNGRDALWFARSRHGSSDYERMARQKCVMNAMLNQLDAVTVLANFQKIASAGKQVMTTDIPASQTDKFVKLAGKAREHKVGSVSFVPPLVQPGEPDFTVIRKAAADTIRTGTGPTHPEAEKAEQQAAGGQLPVGNAPGAAPAQQPRQQPTEDPSASPTPQVPGTDDLKQVCAAA